MRPPQLWTAHHRSVVLVALVGTTATLAAARWLRPTRLPDPPVDGPRAAELSVTLDPNAADAPALAAIPELGEVRARAIVAYRPGHPAFTRPRDLLSVHGVGPSTVANVTPYLSFPDPR